MVPTALVRQLALCRLCFLVASRNNVIAHFTFILAANIFTIIIITIMCQHFTIANQLETLRNESRTAKPLQSPIIIITIVLSTTNFTKT